MSCEISIRHSGSVSIADIRGSITLGQSAVYLRDTLRSLLNNGGRFLLLNLAGVNHVDSAGIGELVALFVSAVRQGGAIKLLHAPESVRKVLDTTRLSMLFENWTDEDDAVKSFSAGSAAGLLDKFQNL